MIYTIDFETEPFENGTPKYPVPVGVSIKIGDEPSFYQSITDTAERALRNIVTNKSNSLLFHNAKFDLRVMNEHLGIPIPQPSQIIDTMIMAYLIDPREQSLGLKELAHKYLGIPPDEQTALRTWLKDHHLPDSHIARAPFELVKPYAEADTDMTYKLYQYLAPKVLNITEEGKQTISDAFKREMAIIPVTIAMEQRGISLSPSVMDTAQWMQDRFDIIDEELALISDDTAPGTKAFFNVLRDKGYIDEDKVQYTEKGNARYGREFLASYIADKELLQMLTDRSILTKLIGTYFKKFAEAYQANGGKFYPYYQQTRGDNDYGTRTGRFSSNLQQLPRNGDEDSAYPFVRDYILASSGHIFLKRDFCLSDDTEFLTDSGFKTFDKITIEDKLAYWQPNHIGYEPYVRKIDQYIDEEVCHIYGAKSVDILCTKDHRLVLQYNRHSNSYFKTKAEDFVVGNAHQVIPQSGYLQNCVPLSESQMVLIAAYQADGSLKTTSTGKVRFKFGKDRKTNRLLAALDDLGIDYEIIHVSYECDDYRDFVWISFYLPDFVYTYINHTKDKTFLRTILTLPNFFLEELKFWDGSNNQYVTTNKKNAELIQELCVLRCVSTTLLKLKDYSYDGIVRKNCYVVSMHKLGCSHTKKFTYEEVPYKGRVVCFEVPHGTLVTRRNGRVAVVGNCGQEIRVAAHYAEGALLQAYKDNPSLDVHTFIQQLIFDITGLDIPRSVVKTIVFMKFYGGGANKLAAMLNISVNLAFQFFEAFDKALPEIKQLMRTVENLSRSGKKIRTWGGRGYDVEETTDGREFYYKLGNVLIQGSSADMTKEAMARYHYHPDRKGHIVLQVHDELVVEVQDKYAKEEMALLKWAMDDIPGWDVPLLSEGAVGYSFGKMTPWED
jgi:DNA polymerase I-like protein with 3'-5' exonuclease and polymerase domains